MTNTEAMLADLLCSGADDWVMASDVAWVARSMGGAKSPNDVRDLSIELIRELLERGLMIIGDVTESGFHAWDLIATDAVDRVAARWRMLRREPSLGDVCWLQLTELGQARVEAIAQGRQTQE